MTREWLLKQAAECHRGLMWAVQAWEPNSIRRRIAVQGYCGRLLAIRACLDELALREAQKRHAESDLCEVCGASISSTSGCIECAMAGRARYHGMAPAIDHRQQVQDARDRFCGTLDEMWVWKHGPAAD